MDVSIFEEAYNGGIPPWDIDHPQGEIVRLAKRGTIGPRVLDVGCGTGENALYLAEHGHEVWGIDLVPAAIARAEEKARRRGVAAKFLVWDALRLEELGRTFHTIIDSGLFHSLGDEERNTFVLSLASALDPGGSYHMLCFSEHEPGTWGPRRVTQAEIREAFGAGWQVESIQLVTFEANLGAECCKAWLASIRLVDRDLAQRTDSQRLI